MLRSSIPLLLLTLSLFALLPPLAAFAQVYEDQVDEWFIDAERAAEKGRDRRAMTLLKRVLEADAEDPEALVLAVRAATNLGEWDQALTWNAALRRLQPDKAYHRLVRIRLLFERGRVSEAIEVLAPLLESGAAVSEGLSWHFEAHALGAEIAKSSGDDERARMLYMRLVNEARNVVVRDPRDLTALSLAYSFLGGIREAETVLLEAQEKAGDDDAWPSLVLGNLYLERLYVQGDAVAEFKRALEIRPNWVPALEGLWRANESWQKGDRAADARSKLLSIRPQHIPLLVEQAASALGNVRYEAAAKALARASEINAKDRSVLAAKAALALMRDGKAAGDKAIEEMLAVDKTYASGLVGIADILNRRRRWPEALDYCRRACEIDPGLVLAWDRRARYAFFLGLDREGHDALRKADATDKFSHVWRRNMFEVRRVLKAFYEEAKSSHFIHRFHRRERQAFVPLAVPFAEQSYDLLVKKYGYVPDGLQTEDHEGKILVEWFKNVTGFNARTLGFPTFGALGVCFGPFIGMNSPGSREPGSFSWARTFHHELAHTITVGLSKGRTTRWLTEGLSTYEEMAFNPTWDRALYRDLYEALESDTLFSVLDFDGGFGTSRVIFAYFQAGLVSRYLVETYGMDKVIEILRGYGEDKTTGQLWPEVLGVGAKEFDQAFQAEVRRILEGTQLQRRFTPKQLDDLEIAASKSAADAEALVDLAVAYVQRRAWLDAQSMVARARSKGSTDQRLQWVEGMAAFGSGQADQGRNFFTAAIEAGFEDFDMRVILAQDAESRQDLAEAERQWKAALGAFPLASKTEDPRLQLARLAWEAERVEDAVALSEEHLQRAFENLPVRKQLIEHYRKTGKTDQELRHLLEWIFVDPLNVEVQRRLADLGEQRSDWKLAARSFEVCLGALLALPKADQDQGKEVDLRLGRARNLMRTGPLGRSAALEELERIRALDPENGEAAELRRTLGEERDEGGGRKP